MSVNRTTTDEDMHIQFLPPPQLDLCSVSIHTVSTKKTVTLYTLP